MISLVPSQAPGQEPHTEPRHGGRHARLQEGGGIVGHFHIDSLFNILFGGVTINHQV